MIAFLLFIIVISAIIYVVLWLFTKWNSSKEELNMDNRNDVNNDDSDYK